MQGGADATRFGSGSNGRRECGSCSVCCTAMNVPALQKPAGQRCVHQTPRGCANYANRPRACRNWHCMWIRDDGHVFADHHRPDRLGVFFTASTPDSQTGSQMVYAHPVRRGAAFEPEAQQVISFLRQFFPVRVAPYRKPRPPHVPLTVDGR